MKLRQLLAGALTALPLTLTAQTFTVPEGTTSNLTNAADVTGAPATLPAGSTFNLSGDILINGAGRGITGTGVGAVPVTVNLLPGSSVITNGAGAGSVPIFLSNGVDTLNLTLATVIARGNAPTAIALGGAGDTANISASIIQNPVGGVALLGLAGGDTVNLNGASLIGGTLNGSGGADVLNFNNWRGFTAADAAALTAAAGPGATAVTLSNGLTFTIASMETVTASGFQTFSSLITTPGLSGFASSLDGINLAGTSNSFFLSTYGPLQVVSAAELNELAKTASGQVYHHAFSNNAFNTATRFTAEMFTTLRQFGLNSSFGSTNVSQMEWSSEGLDPMLHQLDKNLMAVSDTVMAVSDTGSLATATMAASAASTGPMVDSEWQTFVTGSGAVVDQDATDALAESDYINTSATIGASKALTQNLTGGAYVGYQGVDAEIDQYESELDGDGIAVGGFARYQWEDWIASGIIGYNYMTYDGERNIRVGNLTQTAESEPESHQFLAALEFSKRLYFGQDASWRVTPLAGLQYSLLYVDEFNESGMGGGNLSFDDQTAHSLRTRLGFEVAKVIEGSWGWVSPYLSASWNTEILDNSRDIGTTFADPSLASFNVSTEDADTHFGLVGAGFYGSLTEAENIHFMLGWQTQFGQEGYLANSVSGGFRIDL